MIHLQLHCNARFNIHKLQLVKNIKEKLVRKHIHLSV